MLALCAWGENLACGVARQSTANSARQRNEVSVASLATKRRSTINSMKCNEVASVCEQNNVWRHGKFSLASVAKMGGACGQSKQSKNGAVFGRGTSLVARTFWHAFALNLKGFFAHFIANFSYFIVVLSHLFAYKRHFSRYCFKIFKCSFLGLSLRAVFIKNGVASHKFSVVFAF